MCSTMSLANRLVADLQARENLVRLRVKAGLDPDTLLRGLTDGFVAAVCSHGALDVGTVTDVTEAVTTSALLKDEHKHRIATAMVQESVGNQSNARGDPLKPHGIGGSPISTLFEVREGGPLSILSRTCDNRARGAAGSIGDETRAFVRKL